MTFRVTDRPIFYVDAMLGKIAKKLRLLGFDTIYKANISDELLIKEALAQNRVIITKDKRLYQRSKGTEILALLPLRNDELGMLVELLRRYEIRYIDLLPNSYTRCTICNGLLNTISKTLAIKEIPHNVFEHIDVAYRCTSCMKVYWNGTHIRHINSLIIEINNQLY